MEQELQQSQHTLWLTEGVHMRYLAIILLSLAALLRATGTSASAPDVAQATLVAPALLQPWSRSDSGYDRPLAVVLAGALVALQLRRRQKSLRLPRALHG
jgi:hypothetical protein